ncbi:MAG: tyrosine-protein phosphatase, partial [Fusobacteriaceae bacterium]
HTHLLFGVDDGPETLDESVEMIRMATRIGFNEFILTAHYSKGRYKNTDYEKNFLTLQNRVKELEIPVKLSRGNEVYLDENIEATLDSQGYHTILNNRLLVELPPLVTEESAKIMLEKVVKRGFTPILAHIERYKNLVPVNFLEFKKLGVELQINIASQKSRGIIKLLKSGNIDYLASDAHGIEKRSYNIGAELEMLKAIKGEKKDEKTPYIYRVFSNIFSNLFSEPGVRSNT